MVFLKLIRWPNLLIIAAVQYIIRFAIIESLNIPHMLNLLEYTYGVICSMCLAAAGNIINDIYDLDVDRANKPHRMSIGTKGISRTTAWQLFYGFSLMAIFTGYLIAKAAGMINLWMLPLLAIALLYFYAVDLKKRPVIGNILISFLTALPVFFVAVYDLLPVINQENQELIRSGVEVIFAYSLFAFWTNLIREITKDAEDFIGDKKFGYRTLAVILGPEQIRYIIIILTLVMLCFTGFYNVFLFSSDLFSAIYILLFVNLPILFFIYRIAITKTSKDFHFSSSLLKIIMMSGILSMVIFTLSIHLSWG